MPKTATWNWETFVSVCAETLGIRPNQIGCEVQLSRVVRPTHSRRIEMIDLLEVTKAIEVRLGCQFLDSTRIELTNRIYGLCHPIKNTFGVNLDVTFEQFFRVVAVAVEGNVLAISKMRPVQSPVANEHRHHQRRLLSLRRS